MTQRLRSEISFVRRLAPRLSDTRDYEFLRVGAHLFALASKMEVSREDVKKPPKITVSLAALSHSLGQLRDDISPPSLYSQLIAALVAIQAALIYHATRDDGAPPRFTQLTEVDDSGNRYLSGTVYHWIRPPSALARMRRDRHEAAGTKAPSRPKEHPLDHLEQMAMFWMPGDLDHEVSTFHLEGDRQVHLLEESGRAAVLFERFRIALCPMEGECHPLFSVDLMGSRFRGREPECLKDQPSLCSDLFWLIEAAAQERIHVLVLPELMVPRDARDHLAKVLRLTKSRFPFGIVAGSFHVWRKDLFPESAKPVNEAVLLDQSGLPLLHHWKKGEFRVDRSEVKPPWFPDEPPLHLEPRLLEDIEPGTTLEVLDTSLGRLAILICADGIAADADHSFINTIKRLRPDLVLIISMSPKTEDFEATMIELARHWVGSLLVNAHSICKAADPALRRKRAEASMEEVGSSKPVGSESRPFLILGNLALYEPPEAPPTCIRLRYGEIEPERFHFRIEKEGREYRKTWLPLGEAAPEAGISRLIRDGRYLGLVLDLGVHWAYDRVSAAARTVREEGETLDFLAQKG